MTRRRRTVRKFKAFTVYVGKNLSRDVAMSRFMRKTRRDWRGWSYNRKSGYVRAI